MKSAFKNGAKEILKFVAAPGIFTGLFFVFVKIFGVTPGYENIDDFWLKLISSGEFSGEPEANLAYISIVGGAILKAFNAVFPGVSWYGVWMFALYMVSFGAVIYALCGIARKWWAKALVLATFEALFVSFLFVATIFVQYTTVTIVVAGTAIVLYYTGHKVGATTLYAIALTVRIKGALMMLPIFGAVVLIDWILKKSKAERVNILKWAAVTAAISGVLLGVEYVGRNTEPWKSFHTYNTARENIVDYNEFPDYETYREIYDKYGITYESYVAASTRSILLLDKNFNSESMPELASVNSKHDSSVGLTAMLKAFVERHVTSYLDRPLNLIVYALYFITALVALVLRQRKYLLHEAAVFAGRMVIWAYLIWVDRIPTRVSQGAYIVEMCLLSAILVKEFFEKENTSANPVDLGENTPKAVPSHYNRRALICVALALAIMAAVSLKWGLPYAKRMSNYNIERTEFNKTFEQVRNYLAKEPDSFYILDNLSFLYFSEPLLCKNYEDGGNWIYNGNWPTNSPWSDRRLESLGDYSDWTDFAINAPNAFFVFADNETTDWKYLEDYLQRVSPGTKVIQTDKFETPSGFQYYILKAIKDE